MRSPEQCRFPPVPTPQIKRWRLRTHPRPLPKEGKASSYTDPARRTGPSQDMGRMGTRLWWSCFCKNLKIKFKNDNRKPNMVTHGCNLSTPETEAEELL